jgi:hypothetical protein
LVQKFSRIQVYNALALEAKFGHLEKRIKKRKTSNEMKFFRRTAGYTVFDHKRNEGILEEMKAEAVDGILRRYKPNWLRHVAGMENNIMPEIMLNFRPNGGRGFGRPLKRLLDEGETGLSRSNW